MAEINGDANVNRIFGTELGDSILALEGNDFVEAGGGDDTVRGGAGDDIVFGGLGADFLRGQAGNDLLLGGDGNDTLAGGDGNDTLVGGLGNDDLRGSSGADAFVFLFPSQGIDTITNFNIAEGDKIYISAPGFVIDPGDTDSFQYNSATGALNFETTQIATLPQNLTFNPTTDIVIFQTL